MTESSPRRRATRSAATALILLALAAPALAQHGLGTREQWQPQVADTDARLQQPVEIEILGRAAVPALELLSEETGVSLSVAPENLTTVGERKLTIIAQGCTLKDIMAQIPEALQECHWDIDPSGERPIYLLHRNSGVDAAAAPQNDLESHLRSPAGRAARMARVAQARRAIRMAHEEIDQLIESDYQLAAVLQHPEERAALEVFLALPADKMQQFFENGELTLRYGEAPQELRTAARQRLDHFILRDDPVQGTVEEQRQRWLDRLPRAVIGFYDGGSDSGYGIWRVIALPTRGTRDEEWEPVLPPRHPVWGDQSHVHWTIGRGGATRDIGGGWPTIRAILDEHAAPRGEDAMPRRAAPPVDPDLLQTIVLREYYSRELPEIQRAIARETGISVVSDYFTMHPLQVPDEARDGLPLWRLLDLLAEETLCRWTKTGVCLVFHHSDWYALAQSEVPESIILACRERMKTQGELTLADIAAVAAALRDRPIRRDAVPPDLIGAGLLPHGFLHKSALLLYASLSREQRAEVHSSTGLPFADMTRDQRQLVLDLGTSALCIVSPEDAEDAVFLVEQADSSNTSAPYSYGHLVLRFPEESLRSRFYLRRASARSSAPATAAQ